MYKKILFSLFLAIFSLYCFGTTMTQNAFAQTSGMMPGIGNAPFLGQEHSYSVVFRGNGEAIISAKIIFSNQTNYSQSQVQFKIPDQAIVSEISAYQILRDSSCIRYSDPVVPMRNSGESLQAYEKRRSIIISTERQCLEYSSADFSQSYYSNEKYQKVSVTKGGTGLFSLANNVYTVTLFSPIQAQKQGSFFIYFRAFGFANRGLFGKYDYNFETLTVADQIRSVTVGVSTDSDLFLKDAKGSVNYNYDSSSFSSLNLAPMAAGAISDSKVSNYVNQIGQGRVTKSASNLAAYESFSVKGAFADSFLKLYAEGILKFIGILALATIFIVLVLRSLLQMRKNHKTTTKTVGQAKSEGFRSSSKLFMTTQVVSFGVSLIAILYTVAIVYIPQLIMNNSYNYSSNFQPIVFILLVVVSIGIYLTLFFGPVVFMGIKNGFSWAMIQFVSNVIWLGVVTLVLVLVMSLVFNVQRMPSQIDYTGSSPVMMNK